MNFVKALLLFLTGAAAGISLALTINTYAEKSNFARLVEGEPQTYLNLGAGQCRYGEAPDGQWQNRDQEHSNRHKTNGCLQFGAAWRLNPSMGFSIDWVNLGWARNNAQAVACANDKCPPQQDPRRAECNDKLTGDCLYNFRGAGGIKGIKFVATWETPKWHDFSAQFGAGAFAYVIRQSMRVTPLNCTADDRTCNWTREIEQKTRCGLVCLSPEVEATLWWKNLGFGWQHYFRTTQHTNMTAAFGGPANVWLGKVRVTW